MKREDLLKRINDLKNPALRQQLLDLVASKTKKGALDDEVGIKGEVVVVLTNEKTGQKRTYTSKNIVTNDGDLYYAERAALLTTGTPISPVPTNFTDANGVPDMIMELYNGASGAPAKGNDRSALAGLVSGSAKAMDSGYPKVNDADADNTGAGVDIVTYLVSYTKVDFNATGIADVILTNPSPGASEALIMHAEFGTAFDKTANDTLKVFVNHQMNGV